MARPIAWHKIPQTSRVAVTLSSRELKELRKIAIDLEIPETDVMRYAVLSLIERYKTEPVEQIIHHAAKILESQEMVNNGAPKETP